MTDNYPITPPPELVQQWRKSGPADAAVNNAYEQHIATQAVRWGADQELEAMCKLLLEMDLAADGDIEVLRAARRPKPPSLKAQALAALKRQSTRSIPSLVATQDCDIILKALEQLDD